MKGIAMMQPLPTMRDHTVDFDPVTRKSGEIAIVMVQPECLFKVMSIEAADTATYRGPGLGTRIHSVSVGSRVQERVPHKRLTRDFKLETAGVRLGLDVCEPAHFVSITVEFLEDCTFTAKLAGKAVF